MAMNAEDLTVQSRPYAAPSNLVSIFHRVRTRNLPDVIDDEFLHLAGIPEGAGHRVLTALRFLGFIDEDGRVTDDLRSLASSTDEDYPTILEGIIRRAYAADFQRGVDPAQDTQAQIVGAFRPYQPRSQTNRMVILFLGLCREAEMPIQDAPRERQQTSAPRPARPTPRPPRRKKKKEDEEEDQTKGAEFVLTNEDVKSLSDEEFREVWTALGKVVRARSKEAEPKPPADEAGEEADEDGGGGR
ncbi:MAG: DUF5343 domain-containing protein [Actinomycetota bacterium]